MNPRRWSYLLFFLAMSAFSHAEEKPKPVTLTFFIAGMECPACSEVVRQSISTVKGVSDVVMEQGFDGYANVSFDPKAVTAQQIAQAVTDAYPLHGKPYEASIRFNIKAYAKSKAAAKLDQLFANEKQWVEIENIDKDKGEFVLFFEPLKAKEPSKGWKHERLQELLQSADATSPSMKLELVSQKPYGQ